MPFVHPKKNADIVWDPFEKSRLIGCSYWETVQLLESRRFHVFDLLRRSITWVSVGILLYVSFPDLKFLKHQGWACILPLKSQVGKTKVHYLLSLKYYFEYTYIYIYIYDMHILYCIHTYICIIIHRLYQKTLKRSLCPWHVTSSWEPKQQRATSEATADLGTPRSDGHFEPLPHQKKLPTHR